MQKIWAIWSTGKIISAGGNLENIHIERLVLTNPKNEYLMKYMEPICKDNDADKIQRHISQHALTIDEIADSASKTGCEVKLYDGPIRDSIIIADRVNYKGDEFSDDAFVRIETGVPFIEYEKRINIVINKGKNKDAFKAFVKHYNEIWSRSDSYIKNDEKTNPLPEKVNLISHDFHLIWLSEKFFLKDSRGGCHSYNSTDEVDKISLVLRPTIRVNTLRLITVQSIALEIDNQQIPWNEHDANIIGESMTIDDIEFDFPLDTPRGQRLARIRAIVDGKEYVLPNQFIIDFPRIIRQ